MRAEFLEVISENAEASLNGEPGCLRFDVLEDLADDHHFYLYEIYSDAQAVDAHRRTPHYIRWRELSSGLLRETEGITVAQCSVVSLNEVVHLNHGSLKG
jgi:quinol monooxygenase YgiN